MENLFRAVMLPCLRKVSHKRKGPVAVTNYLQTINEMSKLNCEVGGLLGPRTVRVSGTAETE